MVDKTLDLLAGEVRIQVCGASVERFLNLCARSGIRLRRTQRVDFGELHATVPVRDFKRLRSLMGRTGCRVHILCSTACGGGMCCSAAWSGSWRCFSP